MMRKFISITAFSTLASCASGPTYHSEPLEVAFDEVANYWVPEKRPTEKNIKVVSSPGMGCKAVYLEGDGHESDLYVDMKFTIDSKGKQYDQEIVEHSDSVDADLVGWAKTFGLSPGYEFVPVGGNGQPIVSTKRLYFVDHEKLCSKYATDEYLYTNQGMVLTRPHLNK